jgi:hypothetical protein
MPHILLAHVLLPHVLTRIVLPHVLLSALLPVLSCVVAQRRLGGRLLLHRRIAVRIGLLWLRRIGLAIRLTMGRTWRLLTWGLTRIWLAGLNRPRLAWQRPLVPTRHLSFSARRPATKE